MLSKRWEEQKEAQSPPSPSSAYRLQKQRYFTKLAVIGPQRQTLPAPPALHQRPVSHPSTSPMTVPSARPHSRYPAVPSSHSMPSPSVPRSSPMDIPTGGRRNSGAAMRLWRGDEDEAEEAGSDGDGELVDDSRLVWAGRGEGETDYWGVWERKSKYSVRRQIAGADEDEAEPPFPLLPPSYHVDFEL